MTRTAETGSTEPLTVLLADDHVLFRDGLRALLSTAPDLELLGEAIFSPAIARRLLEFFAQLRVVTLPQVFPELIEREILALLAQGAKNAEIASRLVLSPHTVRNYVSNIISKLQVADRTQAISVPERQGWDEAARQRRC